MESTYRITHLAGAARSGADKTGHITHVVTGWHALCGKQPGKHSAGWSEYTDKDITCPKCAKKWAAMHCGNCGNLLEPDEGHKSRIYPGLICDGCYERER